AGRGPGGHPLRCAARGSGWRRAARLSPGGLPPPEPGAGRSAAPGPRGGGGQRGGPGPGRGGAARGRGLARLRGAGRVHLHRCPGSALEGLRHPLGPRTARGHRTPRRSHPAGAACPRGPAVNALWALMGLIAAAFVGSVLMGRRAHARHGLASGSAPLLAVFAGCVLGPTVLGLVTPGLLDVFTPLAQVGLGWLALIMGLDYGWLDRRR